MTEAGSSFTLLPANKTTSDRNKNINLQKKLNSLNKHIYEYFPGTTNRWHTEICCSFRMWWLVLWATVLQLLRETCCLYQPTFYLLQIERAEFSNTFIYKYCTVITLRKNVIFGLKAVKQENWHKDSKPGLLNLKQK